MAVVLSGLRCAYKTQMSSASWQVSSENCFPMFRQFGVREVYIYSVAAFPCSYDDSLG